MLIVIKSIEFGNKYLLCRFNHIAILYSRLFDRCALTNYGPQEEKSAYRYTITCVFPKSQLFNAPAHPKIYKQSAAFKQTI